MMKRQLAAAFVGLAFTILSVGDAGCGSTGSRRFVFDARAGGVDRDVSSPLSFTNAKGWTIVLTKATVTIGPVYLNVAAPLRDDTTSLLSFGRVAHAHDDHLGEGRQAGEVLGRITVDALSPTMVPFGAQGTMTEEQIRTAEVWLWPSPETAPERTAITDPSFEVAGEARRGDERVRFRGTLVIDDAWASDAAPGDRSATPISEIRKVRGIPASFFPVEGGALEVRVDVRPLFLGADFASLASNPEDEDGTKVLVQSSGGKVSTDQVMRNVFNGLRSSTSTYAVRWVLP